MALPGIEGFATTAWHILSILFFKSFLLKVSGLAGNLVRMLGSSSLGVLLRSLIHTMWLSFVAGIKSVATTARETFFFFF